MPLARVVVRACAALWRMRRRHGTFVLSEDIVDQVLTMRLPEVGGQRFVVQEARRTGTIPIGTAWTVTTLEVAAVVYVQKEVAVPLHVRSESLRIFVSFARKTAIGAHVT